MHKLYELKDMLVKELGDFSGKELNGNSLDKIDKLAHAAKNIEKVIECCEDEAYSNAMGGYSRTGGYSRRMSYADNENYPHMDFVRPDGSYRDGGMSYRGRGRGAKRDAMGRYSSEGGVDEHTKEELRKLIEKM